MFQLNIYSLFQPKDLPIQESPFVKALKDEPIKLTNEQEVELGLKSESVSAVKWYVIRFLFVIYW